MYFLMNMYGTQNFWSPSIFASAATIFLHSKKNLFFEKKTPQLFCHSQNVPTLFCLLNKYQAFLYCRIACISAPTAYKKIKEMKPATCTVKCLEFDKRFEIFGEDFQFYDYKEPLNLPLDWKQSFDIVIADPPFLSEECLCKTAVTAKFLTKGKILLCTGRNQLLHYYTTK